MNDISNSDEAKSSPEIISPKKKKKKTTSENGAMKSKSVGVIHKCAKRSVKDQIKWFIFSSWNTSKL